MTDDPARPPQGHKKQAPKAKSASGAANPTGPDVPGADGPAILTQDFDASSLYALRAAVAAHAAHAGVPEPRIGAIVLAVHELAVNAIRHGAGHGQLVIRAYESALHCQVTDGDSLQAARTGTGPESETTSPDDAPWASEQGHGIWFVRRVSDYLSLHTGPHGTIATASFALPPPDPHQ